VATPKNAPASAVSFTVWSANGGPIPQEAKEQLESAVEKTVFELFNQDIRLLTATSYAR